MAVKTIDWLDAYYARMDVATEALGMQLVDMGCDGQASLDDDQIVALATKKLATLHRMLLAAGLAEGILKAVMAE